MDVPVVINYSHLWKSTPPPSSYYGIDPSAQAIEVGKKSFPLLHLSQGTADSLNFDNNFFDAIIFGFCLYLCDREDLFKIAYVANRCLQENGFIIIQDFKPDFYYKNTYKHLDGVFTYKHDYSKMFLWNPQCSLVEMYSLSHFGHNFHPEQNERVAAQVLYKNTAKTYGLTDPYK